MRNFTLHIITHPTLFDGEIEAITKLMSRPEVYLHIRKPECDEKGYESFVRKLPETLYKRVFLHAAYHLTGEFEFAGFHFSTPKRKCAKGVLCNCIKSTSCHSFDDVNIYESEFNQCFLSPIFDSVSKQGYCAAFSTKELVALLKKEREIKIIALGGIAKDNLSRVKAMGFDGAAILGAIWGLHPQKEDDFLGRLNEIIKG